jgi:glycosyltransferase involved in cell wall biosynthesis
MTGSRTHPAQVLFVNPTAQVGGAEYSLLDLAASLDRRRFVPLLACFGDGPLAAAARERDIRVAPLPLPQRFAAVSLKGKRSGPFGLAAAAAAVAPLAWRLRALASSAAIVHTNGNKAHVLGAASAGGARLVWHVRDFWGGGFFERTIARVGNARADAILANSQAVRDHLVGLGLRDTAVHAVPNGIDAVRFAPEGERAGVRSELGWAPDAPLVGIVGMLARWKGQDVLLRAFADVLRQRPAARCLIVGDEIYVTRGQTGFGDELRRLAAQLGIAHAVGFTGYRKDVPALLRALDLVVHASVEPEPFGRVVAEAMACARPVIAADAGGVPEVTGADGDAAVLVRPGDVAALAAQIDRLLGDRAAADRLGAAGRRRVVEMFPVSRHVDQVQAIYERLLASPDGVAVPRTAAGAAL